MIISSLWLVFADDDGFLLSSRDILRDKIMLNDIITEEEKYYHYHYSRQTQESEIETLFKIGPIQTVTTVTSVIVFYLITL